MQKNMFTVSIDKEFDVYNKEYSSTIYLRLYKSLFTTNIIKDLKPRNFTVLLAISSFMDAEGNCYPTQRQIADITGLGLPTVNKAIAELLKYEVNGTPIIQRDMVRNGSFKNSYYTINPISQISLGDKIADDYIPEDNSMFKDLKPKNNNIEKDKEILKYKNLKHEQQELKQEGIEINNSKDVIDYFYQKYREVYGETYTSNFGRDAGQINNKLIGKFTSDQLKAMIDTTVEEYEGRWKNDRFKRPTIVAMCTWLGSEALAVANDKSKQDAEIQEAVDKFNGANHSALSKFGVDLNG